MPVAIICLTPMPRILPGWTVVFGRAINDWLELSDIAPDKRDTLFRPTLSPRGRGKDRLKRSRLIIRSVQNVVKKYSESRGIDKAGSLSALQLLQKPIVLVVS